MVAYEKNVPPHKSVMTSIEQFNLLTHQKKNLDILTKNYPMQIMLTLCLNLSPPPYLSAIIIVTESG